MERDKIKFKAIHEGMGFHPFSDGLPYAPESKAKYQNGAGATAAGRPQFVTQSFTSSPAVKTARQLEAAKKVHVPMNAHTPPLAQTISPTAQAPQAKTQTSASILRARVFAYLLDSIVHASFWLGTNFAALFFFKFQIDSEILRDSLPQFIIFYVISQWMFIALQEGLFGSTVGKTFFKLEFERDHRSLFLRSIVFMMGLLAFGTGLYFRPQDRFGQLQLKA